MELSRLPLKIRVGIRDHWDNTDCSLQKERAALKETLGIDVKLEVNWDTLLMDLGAEYSDKSTFVPSVAACVQSFLEGLREILDAEQNPEWADTLLENANGVLRLIIGISKKDEFLVVLWSTECSGFQVNLTREAIPSLLRVRRASVAQLLHCFDESQPSLNDWADVSIEAAKECLAIRDEDQSFDLLPDINTLPCPDDLLLKPPYHLTVYGGGKTTVEVQCSHSPTLELLAEYLKKWCKINHQDTRHPRAVEIELHQSSFGFGLTYDRLTMSVQSRNPNFLVSPMIVLPFIESILGYKSVSADGSSWIFRRDKELRRSGR
ncbi:hypothetical protein F5Y11DRAFT_312688 [Daldinia sp. FL1419]|nr:hypothetical protein F5Y11DRAFT_312688 [Daldinia sp. FL1419]